MKSFITIITLLTAFVGATPAASSQTKACTRPCFPEATECGEGWEPVHSGVSIFDFLAAYSIGLVFTLILVGMLVLLRSLEIDWMKL
ncbi:hypothetical protein AA0112_g4610 [Alternaria arborescens]|nr:hypothetical protein AA0112_g4610 [Alternaria arborescens]